MLIRDGANIARKKLEQKHNSFSLWDSIKESSILFMNLTWDLNSLTTKDTYRLNKKSWNAYGFNSASNHTFCLCTQTFQTFLHNLFQWYANVQITKLNVDYFAVYGGRLASWAKPPNDFFHAISRHFVRSHQISRNFVKFHQISRTCMMTILAVPSDDDAISTLE